MRDIPERSDFDTNLAWALALEVWAEQAEEFIYELQQKMPF